MKVLCVVPDGNVLDRIAWLAKCNPDVKWHIIGVAPDCEWEAPLDWAESFECLNCDYREVKNYPQEPSPFLICRNTIVAYEYDCEKLRSPLLGYWYHYDVDTILEGENNLLHALGNLLPNVDAVITWGERGWYNYHTIEQAEQYSNPVLRLERASFPGMFVADAVGLEQGKCQLDECHRMSLVNSMCPPPDVMLRGWLTVAPWQNIEAQPRTTLGMVRKLLDNRPSIFVPLQVPVDTNMIFRANGVCRNYDLLQHVATNYPGWNVLVKKHPGDGFTSDDALDRVCGELGFQRVNMATQAIIRSVDKVVSINSQCIIEAWMHNKPVEILGQPAFDLPDEDDKQALLHTLRFDYYIEPWGLTERLRELCRNA